MIKNRYSFPPSDRLRKRGEYLRLQKTENRYSCRAFLVVWEPNSVGFPRLGITASKKVGCSVVRNRIKRNVREIFRTSNSLIPPVDLNVIARSGAKEMEHQHFKAELLKAFSRIGSV